MIDTNELFKIIIAENLNIESKKSKKLEQFRLVESELKQYIYTLIELEKLKNSSNVHKYTAIYMNMISRLENFNPINIDSNLDPVKNEYQKLLLVEKDLSEIFNKMNQVNNLWKAFLSRNESIDLNSKFIQNIDSKVNVVKDMFASVGFNELTRVDDELSDLKRSINHSIDMIEDLKTLISDNTFVGSEAINLRNELKNFIDTEYKDMDLVMLNERHAEIELKINKIRKTTKVKRERVEVVKLSGKSQKNIYNYGVYIHGVFINLSDMPDNDLQKEHLKEYIYIDNFPVRGIFKDSSFAESLDIADDQFHSIAAFNSLAFAFFSGFAFLSIFTLSFTLFGSTSPLITFPLVLAYLFLFKFIFIGMKYRIDDRYSFPNQFYFFKIDYVFASFGDDSFRYTQVIPGILLNFDKILKNRDGVSDAEQP